MKFAASKTLKRVGASALIVSSMLTATGCGYIYKQPTTIVYSASDGQMANLLEGSKEVIQLRNIMVISSGENEAGRLLGTILNQDDEKDATVALAFPTETVTINVPAGKEIRLEEDANAVTLTKTGTNPGLTLKDVKVSSNTKAEDTTFNVPVLDGSIEEYAPYLPNAASTSAPATDEAGVPAETGVPAGEQAGL